MKAFLLAAGLGTRLRPITDTVPKCMVPVSGKPMLYWWFELLRHHGVSEVLVNTHYLPEPVREYIQFYNTQQKQIQAIEFYEKELLGSGGTVKANFDFVKNEEDFLICYADNLTDMNLTAMMKAHKKQKTPLTMALFRTNKPEQCGIAALDGRGRIIRFMEKPSHPESNLANAGIYAASQEIFQFFPDKDILDFGKNVLPRLTGRMYGYPADCYLLDIGTIDNYHRAQEEWHHDHY